MEYLKLNENNFNEKSLDNFIRRQRVTRCWRKIDGVYKLTPVSYTEDWSLDERREFAEKILSAIKNGSIAFAAATEGDIVGFALVMNEKFGSCGQYIDLAEFYVSEPFRRKGIGKTLFKLACEAAKELGGKKLYVSAHSAEDSIAAYQSYGCVFTKEVNKALAEKEPFDLQLECELD